VVQFTVELLGRLIVQHFGPKTPGHAPGRVSWPVAAREGPAPDPARIHEAGRGTP
jgi:hypothetical protein